mgnify:CR=1 FL=1
MGYVLSVLSALVGALLVWLIAALHQGFGTGGGMLVAMTAWNLLPFAVLAALYRASVSPEERVMFFAGALSVLMFCLGFLFDLIATGQFGEMGVSFVHLPLYVSAAFVLFWIAAPAVAFLYQRTPHQGKHIGWGTDVGEEL